MQSGRLNQTLFSPLENYVQAQREGAVLIWHERELSKGTFLQAKTSSLFELLS